jgi:predicted  nucleic acid-binding Zn-ribbon protein
MFPIVEAARIPSRLLGELLVEDGLITTDELEDALVAQAECGKRLGEVLVERKLVSGPELTAALMKQFGVEMAKQDGFGAGLWTEIKRRHREARSAEGGPVDPNYPRLEPVNPDEQPPDNVVVLDRLLDAAEEAPAPAAADAPATIGEAAAFAARLAEADEALTLESAYLEYAERDLETLRAELSSRDARIEELERSAGNESELEAELDALTAGLAEAEEMIARETEARELAEREAARASAGLAELRTELDTVAERLAEAETVDPTAPARIAELEGELGLARADSARLESIVSSMSEEAERLAQQLADSDEALVREAGLRQELETDLHRLRADATEHEERLTDLERQVGEMTFELAEERMRYATTEEARGAAADALAREQLARERVEAELFELRGELDAVAARLAEAEAPPLAVEHADHLVFAPGEAGYELTRRTGTPPELGTVTELGGVELRVVKIGRSPLPDDPRPCAYLAA